MPPEPNSFTSLGLTFSETLAKDSSARTTGVRKRASARGIIYRDRFMDGSLVHPIFTSPQRQQGSPLLARRAGGPGSLALFLLPRIDVQTRVGFIAEANLHALR